MFTIPGTDSIGLDKKDVQVLQSLFNRLVDEDNAPMTLDYFFDGLSDEEATLLEAFIKLK